MKRPKIKLHMVPSIQGGWFAELLLDLNPRPPAETRFPTKKAAREWAKEWCRSVGAALMEKGK